MGQPSEAGPIRATGSWAAGSGGAAGRRSGGRPESSARRPHLVVVGVCASGKSTLKERLTRLGYSVESVAQEHSLVARLWRRACPDVLIVLNCGHSTIVARRQNPEWPYSRLVQQRARLEEARKHADVHIETDGLSPQELVDQAVAELHGLGVEPPHA